MASSSDKSVMGRFPFDALGREWGTPGESACATKDERTGNAEKGKLARPGYASAKVTRNRESGALERTATLTGSLNFAIAASFLQHSKPSAGGKVPKHVSPGGRRPSAIEWIGRIVSGTCWRDFRWQKRLGKARCWRKATRAKWSRATTTFLRKPCNEIIFGRATPPRFAPGKESRIITTSK